MLEIRNIRAGYGQTEVLRGLDMEVREGELVAVLGSNGVGKTTLNKVLSGMLPATSGTIRFDGMDLQNASSVRIVEAGLIHVPEGRRIFPNLSVRENLELGSYLRAKANRARNLEMVYATFPRLLERSAQLAGTLSGGEQQMLAIGRGLMAEPRLLILDEPSLGLSPLLVEEMFALVKGLNASGMPIMLVEQNVVQSLDLVDRAYVVENGTVTMSGAAADLRADPEVRRVYLGL